MQAEGAAVLIILNEPSLNGALRDPVYVSEDAGLLLRESVCNWGRAWSTNLSTCYPVCGLEEVNIMQAAGM